MQEPALAADRITLLQTFLRIVESGSLSAAAAQLQSTQPTVSRRLQALEKLFGVRLLQRSTHALKLTPDGERCFAMARSLVDEWEAMKEDLRGARGAPAGALKVLVPHALGQVQLVEPLAAYLRAHPAMRVEWLLHDRRPDFVREGIDCAIQVGTLDDPSVVAVPLYEVPRILVCAPALVQGRAMPQEPADLANWPWLAVQTFYRDRVVLQRAGTKESRSIAIQPRLATDNLYALRSAALAGLGVAIVSGWMVTGDLQAGLLVHLAPDWAAAPLPVHLVYPYARYQPARLRRFIEVVKQHAAASPSRRASDAAT